MRAGVCVEGGSMKKVGMMLETLNGMIQLNISIVWPFSCKKNTNKYIIRQNHSVFKHSNFTNLPAKQLCLTVQQLLSFSSTDRLLIQRSYMGSELQPAQPLGLNCVTPV